MKGVAMPNLTAELITKVCRLEEETGLYPERLLVSEGVRRRTAKEWMRIGEECSASEDAATDHQRLCVELFEQMDEAQATVERRWWAEYDAAIEKANVTGKNAGALAMITRLERRFPDRYKRVQAERSNVEDSPEKFFAEMEAREAAKERKLR